MGVFESASLCYKIYKTQKRFQRLERLLKRKRRLSEKVNVEIKKIKCFFEKYLQTILDTMEPGMILVKKEERRKILKKGTRVGAWLSIRHANGEIERRPFYSEIEWIGEGESVLVRDLDEEICQEKQEVYLIKKKDLIELPQINEKRLAIHKKGISVYAVYPKTTSFYKAKILKLETPSKGDSEKGKAYLVVFDDEDEIFKIDAHLVSVSGIKNWRD